MQNFAVTNLSQKLTPFVYHQHILLQPDYDVIHVTMIYENLSNTKNVYLISKSKPHIRGIVHH